MTQIKRGRVGIAAALAAGALLIAPIAAQAETLTVPHLKADSYKLHIHKHETPAGGAATQDPKGTGTQPAGAAIGGAEFTVYRISDINLDQPADWGKVSAFKVDGDTCANAATGTVAGHTVENKGKKETSEAGLADFDFAAADAGAYIVCETKTPAGVTRAAAPFVVTLPFPYKGEWLSEVHAYPKNTKSKVEKTVSPQTQYGAGATVKFPVTANFGAVADDERYNLIQIADPMPNTLTAVGAEEVTIAGKPATVNTDYTVGLNAENNTVVVTLTAEGLKKFPREGGDVKVVFTSTAKQAGAADNTAHIFSNVVKVPGPDGEIPPIDTPPVDPNKPVVPPTDPDSPIPGVPTNKVTTNWGKLTVKKHDAEKAEKGLDGAVFEVYPAKVPYADTEQACSKEIAEGGQPVSVNGETTFTTTNGQVEIDSLFVSDSVNEKKDATFRCYVLKEVTAPSGYVLPTDPTTAVAVKANADTATEINVPNTQQTIPGLPLTGADGRVLALLVGGAIVLGGAGTIIVASRRRQA